MRTMNRQTGEPTATSSTTTLPTACHSSGCALFMGFHATQHDSSAENTVKYNRPSLIIVRMRGEEYWQQRQPTKPKRIRNAKFY
jgi:hypothetical protein